MKRLNSFFFYLGNSVEQKNVCCCENKYFSLLCPLTYTLLELDLSTVINSLSILLGYIYIVEVLALAAVTLAFSRRVVGAPHLIRKPLLRAWNRTTRRLHLTKFFLTKIIRMYLCIVMAARFSSRSRFPSSSWYSSSFRNIYRSQTQILINLSLIQTFVVSVVSVLFFSAHLRDPQLIRACLHWSQFVEHRDAVFTVCRRQLPQAEQGFIPLTCKHDMWGPLLFRINLQLLNLLYMGVRLTVNYDFFF